MSGKQDCRKRYKFSPRRQDESGHVGCRDKVRDNDNSKGCRQSSRKMCRSAGIDKAQNFPVVDRTAVSEWT